MLGKKAWKFTPNEDAIITKVFKTKYFHNGRFLDIPLRNNPSYVWKEDVVVTKVFKAKYFPMGSFLDAPLGNNPSFIWRDIRASQVLIKSGFKWRIGNGHLIMCGINLGLNMAGILMS